MACGCAVVSTDCGGPSDQIEHGVNGFLTPVDDAEQMVVHVLKLLDDSGLRRRFVSASREKLARFTWPQANRRFEAVITEIISKCGDKPPSSSASGAVRER